METPEGAGLGALGAGPGIIVGVGVGAAASAALQPAIEIPKQEAWARNANRLLNPELLARLVASGGITLGAAHSEARREGYGGDKVNALVYLAQTVPAVAEAVSLRRRKLISPELFHHVLVKMGLDGRYVAPITNSLEAERLSPQDLAYAVVRGLVPDEGMLPVAPPGQGVKVKRFPVSPLNPVTEAAESGLSKERLRVLVGRSGLSMGPVMAAQAFFRNIIERPDFDLAIAEGDLRNEWRDAILDVSRQILTAGEYAELELRGFLTREQRRARTDRHGMSHADSDLLYDVLGRSLPVHAVTTALARGGKYGGTYAAVPKPYREAIQRSNIREEWAGLAYANRYSYPSAFVLRSLTQSGQLTEAEAHDILLRIGWEPGLAKKVAHRWAAGTAAKPDPHVAKAQTQLWTTLHRSYLNHESDEAQAEAAFALLGVTAAARPKVLALWTHERAIVRRTLTPSQIKKAWKETKLTHEDALVRLERLGMGAADAELFLEE